MSTVHLAVGSGHVLGQANEDRELSTSAGGNNLLVSGGSVVDKGRDMDVVDGALASLVVARKAPGVGLAVLANSKAVVGTGSNRHDVRDTWEMVSIKS